MKINYQIKEPVDMAGSFYFYRNGKGRLSGLPFGDSCGK